MSPEATDIFTTQSSNLAEKLGGVGPLRGCMALGGRGGPQGLGLREHAPGEGPGPWESGPDK